MLPGANWTVLSLCRKSDPDRSSKFYEAMKILGAQGVMGNLDDSPEQTPPNIKEVEEEILSILPENEYDLILTHSIHGEYNKHHRRNEIAEGVINLIEQKRLKTNKLWVFAYEDGKSAHLPKSTWFADQIMFLPTDIWGKKYELITQTYGFSKDSCEAKTAPRNESFWAFASAYGVKEWLKACSFANSKY